MRYGDALTRIQVTQVDCWKPEDCQPASANNRDTRLIKSIHIKGLTWKAALCPCCFPCCSVVMLSAVSGASNAKVAIYAAPFSVSR